MKLISYTAGSISAITAASFGSWYVSYPKFPSSSSTLPVNIRIFSVKSRLNNKTPMTQVFFPFAPDDVEFKQANYMRDEAIDGLINYLRIIPKWALAVLRDKCHPCHDENALIKQYAEHEKLPIVIFSHGLGGSCELYSYFCKQLASTGCIVIAIESEDGSGSFAKDVNNNVIPYKRVPDGFDFNNRQHIRDFRQEFLVKRNQEINSIMTAVEKKDKLDPMIKSILAKGDSSRLILAGHSFGGASTMNFTQQNKYNKNIKGVIGLDVWTTPLPESNLKKGINYKSLFIDSEHFNGLKDSVLTKELIESSKDPIYIYIKGARHQIFSDTFSLAPQFITRKLRITGDTDIDIAVRDIGYVCSEFLKLVLNENTNKISIKERLAHVDKNSDIIVIGHDTKVLPSSEKIAVNVN